MLRDFIKKIVKGTISAARTSSGEFLLKKTDFGLVRVDFAVVQKIAERAVKQVEGIHEAEIAVEKVTNSAVPMEIRLTMTLEEGFSAPKASAAADRAINDALKDSLETGFYVPVAVKVQQIEKVVPKKRRVR